MPRLKKGQAYNICKACDGTGRPFVLRPSIKCEVCNGKGYTIPPPQGYALEDVPNRKDKA